MLLDAFTWTYFQRLLAMVNLEMHWFFKDIFSLHIFSLVDIWMEFMLITVLLIVEQRLASWMLFLWPAENFLRCLLSVHFYAASQHCTVHLYMLHSMTSIPDICEEKVINACFLCCHWQSFSWFCEFNSVVCIWLNRYIKKLVDASKL